MKFCPECGSILSDTKCSVCGYEESITEKKISTKTSSVTKNNLLNNIDKIHTSYKSDSKVLKIMNIDNINIVNYVIDIIKDNNSKVSLKDGYYICKNDDNYENERDIILNDNNNLKGNKKIKIKKKDNNINYIKELDDEEKEEKEIIVANAFRDKLFKNRKTKPKKKGRVNSVEI